MRTKKAPVIGQILLWSSGWLLISYLLNNGGEYPWLFFHRALASFIGIVSVVVVNLTFLLPKFYFQKKLWYFLVLSAILIAAVTLLIHSSIFPWAEWFNPQPFPTRSGRGIGHPGRLREAMKGIRWLGHVMPFLVAFLGSTLVEVARFANQKEKEAIRSEKEKLETEIKFLKSQVNPHFLFNALNNIYSLTLTRSEQAAESVMQLSEILRYMVYDANEEKVPLKKEINYIENYVNLKLLKDSRGMNVQLDLDRSAPDLMIAPLLFIPFVENAFKHSKIENLESGAIKIRLHIETDGSLIFQVQNSVPENDFTKDKVGGVGLENIQKRLHLLYPEPMHLLKIEHSEQHFSIWLKIVVS